MDGWLVGWMNGIQHIHFRVIAVSTVCCCCVLKASVAPHWVWAMKLSVCVYEWL